MTGTPDDDTIVTASNRVGRRLPDLDVDGISEVEIFSHAPVLRCDRIYWSTDRPLDLTDLLTELGPDAHTRQWSDGLKRIWVPVGRGNDAREVIREWCQRQGEEAQNLRCEHDVPFRDLELIPEGLLPSLIAACVDWLYPHTLNIRRRLVAEIAGIDEDDVRGMMYLFIHDLADRYDSERIGRNGNLNFTAFALGKLRTWPQDAARAAYGRTLVSDRAILHRLSESVGAEQGRTATEFEKAEALGVSVTEFRRREEAVEGLSRIRRTDSIFDDDGAPSQDVHLSSVDDVESDALARSQRADITREIFAAVTTPKGPAAQRQDPLSLAILYLSFWEGMSRTEIAQELDIAPKTVSSVMARSLQNMDQDRLS